MCAYSNRVCWPSLRWWAKWAEAGLVVEIKEGFWKRVIGWAKAAAEGGGGGKIGSGHHQDHGFIKLTMPN